jgi:type I restriction enzyme S subunit
MNEEVKGCVGQTELGDLPEQWDVKRIGEVAEVKGGKRLPKGHQFADERTLYPYIRVVDFRLGSVDPTNLRYLKPSDYEKIKRYTVSHDDVYISIAGTIGLAGVVPIELDGANLTENAAKLVVKDKSRVDKHFLAHFLNSSIGQLWIERMTMKQNQPKLALMRIKLIPIPLPSLPEQRRIAGVLRLVDELIDRTRQLVGQYQHLKKLALRHLLTRGIGHTRFKQTEFGELPEEWETEQLGTVSSQIIGGGTPSRRRPEYWNGYIPWLSPSELADDEVNEVYSTKESITAEGSVNSNAKLIPANSVLLTCTATVGKVAINRIPLTTNQQFNAFVLNPKRAVPEFVAYALLDRKPVIERLGGQTTFRFISKPTITDFRIPLPPLPEQCEIAEHLQKLDVLIDNERHYAETLGRLKRAWLDQLLMGKVRVPPEAEEILEEVLPGAGR